MDFDYARSTYIEKIYFFCGRSKSIHYKYDLKIKSM